MKRLLPSFLVLLGLGVASVAVAAPPPRADRAGKVAQVACTVAGVWRGSGVDVAHTRWDFTLTLTQTDTSITGFFDWRGSDGHDGREHVAGRVNCRTRRLDLRGVALENAPALALARYLLTLNASFSALAGRWTGGVPGTLQATRAASP